MKVAPITARFCCISAALASESRVGQYLAVAPMAGLTMKREKAVLTSPCHEQMA
jgi:hypothetical protein